MNQFWRGAAGLLMAGLAIALVTFLGITPDDVLVLVATGAAATTRDLRTILADLEKLQNDYKGKRMPEDVGKQFEELAAEAKALQDEADRARRIGDVKRWSGQPAGEPALPESQQPAGEQKGDPARQVVGFLTLGEAAAQSPDLAQFIKAGMPRGSNWRILEPVGVRRPRGSATRVLPITKGMLDAIQTKAVPTLGGDVIEPQRLSEIVRVTEQDRLTLRDVLNTATTSSDAVTYVQMTSFTRAAAPVAAGSPKPEATMALTTVTESVRTVAVWIPVHNNQLADFGQLRNLIDVELLWDLEKAIEELIMYGDGTGENFQGIVDHDDVLAARTEAEDTLIDIIRRGATDVRVAGLEPNAVVIHPLDWEDVELEKGSDNRYVWAVIRDLLGPRIWGMRVVESIGAEETATGRRTLVVGDFMRGATLWQRSGPDVSVGWIDQQFIKNQRTLLAEERAAFGVKRPLAFRTHETNAVGS